MNKHDTTTPASSTIKKEDKPASVEAKSHEAPPKESEAANPQLASIEAIKVKLADPTLREDFIDNVADLICSYSKRKLDEDEKQSLRNLVDNELISRVFKIKKLAV